MTEIRFYHLTTRGVDDALPEILQKAVGIGHRIIVRCPDVAEVDRLNQHLWTYRADTFLPHGSAKDGGGADQPVWLTAGNDNPNNANVLIIIGGLQMEDAGQFTLCCDIFNGRDDDQISRARARWADYKNAGHTLTYWQQSEKGWVQKT